MTLQTMLERDEGRRNTAYPDPLTRGDPWTIGIGHCGPEVCRGLVWSDAKIDEVFASDVAEKTDQCSQAFPWLDDLDEPRRAVIIAMCFQMGLARLSAFQKMLAAVGRGDYSTAADCMLDSIWAHQTPVRAARMAYQMRTGLWV